MPNQTGMAITCLPIKTCPVEDDWRLSLNPGEPGRARTSRGTGPTRRHSPCTRLYGATDESWGGPGRGEPTRQEPVLLSNHDGAAAPGPARLCNDLKQESRPQAPTPFQNMGHKSEERGGRPDLEPGTWNLHLTQPQPQPHLDSQLDSARFYCRLSPLMLILALIPTWPCPFFDDPAAIRHVPHPSETKSRLLLQTSRPPDGTWLNAGSVMLCLTRSLIAHQSLLPTLTLRAWTTTPGRSIFAYGCPSNRMGRIGEIVVVFSRSLCTRSVHH